MSAEVTSQEQRVLALLRQLPPTAVNEVEDFVVFLAARSATWSYSDPSSIEHAARLMASDPFLRREVEAINADSSAAESDGLEDY
jgi:hypothetical protein